MLMPPPARIVPSALPHSRSGSTPSPLRAEPTGHGTAVTQRRGLLGEPERSPGGHRRYDDRAVQVLRIIKAAQRLGFTLEEVADLIEAGRRRGRRSGLQDRAREKLAEVEARIADLETIRTTLVAALDAGCDDLHVCATSDCCPLPFTEIAIRGEPGTACGTIRA